MEQEICNISWEEVERGVSSILSDINNRNNI